MVLKMGPKKVLGRRGAEMEGFGARTAFHYPSIAFGAEAVLGGCEAEEGGEEEKEEGLHFDVMSFVRMYNR